VGNERVKRTIRHIADRCGQVDIDPYERTDDVNVYWR